jgi:hypothetical protein
MKTLTRSGCALFIVASWLVSATALAADFNQLHAAFDAQLKQNVKSGRVNYSALKANPKPLDDYLAELAVVSENDFNKWPKKERLAFLINLYNGSTLKLIVNHYPIKSIKKIGGLFSSPFDQPAVRAFGKTMTLNQLEHGIIRPQYHEPRVHFALVCAAKGCPPLRSEAYLGSRLDEQLDNQAKIFLANPEKNRVEDHTVFLSPIFKWYGDDFTKKYGSVLNFVRQYFSQNDAKSLRTATTAQDEFKIKYTDYDWSLNDTADK